MIAWTNDHPMGWYIYVSPGRYKMNRILLQIMISKYFYFHMPDISMNGTPKYYKARYTAT